MPAPCLPEHSSMGALDPESVWEQLTQALLSLLGCTSIYLLFFPGLMLCHFGVITKNQISYCAAD